MSLVYVLNSSDRNQYFTFTYLLRFAMNDVLKLNIGVHFLIKFVRSVGSELSGVFVSL